MARPFNCRDIASQTLSREGWRATSNPNAFERRTESGEKLGALILPALGMGQPFAGEPCRVETWSMG